MIERLETHLAVSVPSTLLPEVMERVTATLKRGLFGEELKVWMAVLQLHDDSDPRSHLWHLPEVESWPTTTTSISTDTLLNAQNQVLITAERPAPTIFCRRKEPWT